jgi:16S rRNA (guanine966-N2)-methyltransferase
MRIVGGQFRGRRLATPQHEGLRPTSDQVREAVFNILAHGVPDLTLADAKVMDLFAGTGALGLEALSRGASFCLFVEQDADARGLIRRNIELLGLAGVTRIFRRDATNLGPAGHRGGFSLVFLDPPYEQGLGERAITSAAEGGWLRPGAIAVLEERADVEIVLPEPFSAFDRRAWGDTQAVFARFMPPGR